MTGNRLHLSWVLIKYCVFSDWLILFLQYFSKQTINQTLNEIINQSNNPRKINQLNLPQSITSHLTETTPLFISNTNNSQKQQEQIQLDLLFNSHFKPNIESVVSKKEQPLQFCTQNETSEKFYNLYNVLKINKKPETQKNKNECVCKCVGWY